MTDDALTSMDNTLPQEDEQGLESTLRPQQYIQLNGAVVIPNDQIQLSNQQQDLHANVSSSISIESNNITTQKHIKAVLRIATPIILSEIFQNILPVVDLAFVGNLGKVELAAASLATVWFNLWNVSMFGFLTAIDTILSQSCGAEEWEAFGMWTGTFLIVTVGVSMLAVGAVATCGPAMILFGQQEELANLAGAFALRLLPGMIPFYLFKVLTKYLQTQNILLPSVIIGIFANAINIVVNYLLIYKLGLGLIGAPWATTLTRLLELVMIVIYMFWKKKTILKKTWPSFQLKAMTYKALKPFWKLAISGSLSLTCEGWSFEITTILAGLLGTVELDAHSITLGVAAFLFFSFPFAIGIATSIRVGQLIGEGKPADAKRAYVVSTVFAAVTQICIGAIYIPCRGLLGKLFSNDEDVVNLVKMLIPISGIFMLGDAVQANAIGTCRGLGRFDLSLMLNIVAYWVLAVPMGAILTFVVKLGVSGLWWGFNIGLYAAGLLGFFLVMYVVDWDKEARKAVDRIKSINEDKEGEV